LTFDWHGHSRVSAMRQRNTQNRLPSSTPTTSWIPYVPTPLRGSGFRGGSRYSRLPIPWGRARRTIVLQLQFPHRCSDRFLTSRRAHEDNWYLATRGGGVLGHESGWGVGSSFYAPAEPDFSVEDNFNAAALIDASFCCDGRLSLNLAVHCFFFQCRDFPPDSPNLATKPRRM